MARDEEAFSNTATRTAAAAAGRGADDLISGNHATATGRCESVRCFPTSQLIGAAAAVAQPEDRADVGQHYAHSGAGHRPRADRGSGATPGRSRAVLSCAQ